MSSRTDRRAFLRSTAQGGLGLLVLKNSQSVSTAQANEKLNIALVGIGGRGTWFVDTIPQMENVVAVCDVNEQRAAESFQKLPDTPRFRDYREMLSEMTDQIDAIIVATPDHSHAGPSIMAMKMGKNVFCEKPLTHNVREARLMRETARECQVATQMGNQGTASQAFRRALELIQQGVLGEIRDVYVWKDSGGPGHRARPQDTPPVPEYLKWELGHPYREPGLQVAQGRLVVVRRPGHPAAHHRRGRGFGDRRRFIPQVGEDTLPHPRPRRSASVHLALLQRGKRSGDAG
jgi:hypothetical protein